MINMIEVYRICNRFYRAASTLEEQIQHELTDLQSKWPQASLKSSEELLSFINQVVPPLIYQYMIVGRTTKACSGISPSFGVLANEAGFAVFLSRLPGHIVNVSLCSDGIFQIDLSNIQFQVDSNQKEWKEHQRLLQMVARDPFAAIQITRLNHLPSLSIPERDAMCAVNGTEEEVLSSAQKQIQQIQDEGPDSASDVARFYGGKLFPESSSSRIEE